MFIADIMLLAIALAMDCFAVSIVSGIIRGTRIDANVFRMCFLFGLFQAAMPFIGWLCINKFSGYLEALDHWIAFAMLLFIGLKMIRDSAKGNEVEHFNPCRLHTQLILAVATSIDALAVGISFACLGYKKIEQLSMPLIVIGTTSLILAMLGYTLGVRYGHSIAQRLKPELLGGIILIFIGIKILLSHLLRL